MVQALGDVRRDCTLVPIASRADFLTGGQQDQLVERRLVLGGLETQDGAITRLVCCLEELHAYGFSELFNFVPDSSFDAHCAAKRRWCRPAATTAVGFRAKFGMDYKK